MSKPEISHIARARLPWRSAEDLLTECGLPASGHPTSTRQEFVKRHKEMGDQRCSLFTCMTCWDTVHRWGEKPVAEGDDIRTILKRELEWEGDGRWAKTRGTRLRDELRAIVSLIEHHRDEFDTLSKAVVGTRLLSDARREREEYDA